MESSLRLGNHLSVIHVRAVSITSLSDTGYQMSLSTCQHDIKASCLSNAKIIPSHDGRLQWKRANCRPVLGYLIDAIHRSLPKEVYLQGRVTFSPAPYRN